MSSYDDMLYLSPHDDTDALLPNADILSLSAYADIMATQINSLRDLVAAVRGRRKSLGWTQSELANRAHVSRQWISEFETGKPTAELGLVIRLLDALDLRLTLDSGEQRQPAGEESAMTVDLDAVLDDYRSR
jgi:HTH-type transcriptional regulator/antitoxin HipB